MADLHAILARVHARRSAIPHLCLVANGSGPDTPPAPRPVPDLLVKNLRTTGSEGAFSCSLYCDGRRVAVVWYDGCGGPYGYEWSDRLAQRRIEVWVEALPAELNCDDSSQVFHPDADTIINRLCCVHELLRKMKRICRTEILFRLQADPDCDSDDWRSISGGPLSDGTWDEREAAFRDWFETQHPTLDYASIRVVNAELAGGAR